jgi:hypothetical protein
MNIVIESLFSPNLAVLVLLACHELRRARPVRGTHDPGQYYVQRRVFERLLLVLFSLNSKGPMSTASTTATWSSDALCAA